MWFGWLNVIGPAQGQRALIETGPPSSPSSGSLSEGPNVETDSLSGVTEPVSGRVSIVIPTRNSAATLPALLRSARDQDHTDVEVLVVDNASQDDTVLIAERVADVVAEAGPERSAQRNYGAELASGEFLLFLDADMVVEREVVSACVATVRATGAAAVVIPERTVGSGFLARVRALERSCYVGDDTVEAARFFTASAFHSQGGYDLAFTGVEDWDLPARMRAAGLTQSRIDVAFIDHDESGTKLVGHLRKKFYYAKTAGPYVRRHGRLAARQAVVLRPAFRRHRDRLLETPGLSVALLGLKIAEAGVAAAGLATGMFTRDR